MANRIVVELRRDQFQLPYQDNLQDVLAQFGAHLQAAWNTLAAFFAGQGVTLSLNRLLTAVPPEQIASIQQRAQAVSQQQPPDLFSLMAVDLAGPGVPAVDSAALVAALKALPFVRTAYEEHGASQAVDPSDDVLASLQGYLGPPVAGGIASLEAWQLPGSDGAGVRFVDVEWGWLLSHEDLAGAAIQSLNPRPVALDIGAAANHGTSVLGVVLAQDNAIGVIGIAPKCTGAVASARTPAGVLDIPNGLLAAVTFAQAGDVVLLELQTDPAPHFPIEIDPHITLLIRTMALMGIIVVECAGNGSQDLNLAIRGDGTVLDRTQPMFVDSGAIVVGARGALLNNRRLGFSNHGNRVDCCAWGELIVTTAATTNSLGQRYAGIGIGGAPAFGGTSGAGAIVAGAAVSLQGIAKARGLTLTPGQMRTLLSDPAFNTMTQNPAADAIGVMPYIRGAANEV